MDTFKCHGSTLRGCCGSSGENCCVIPEPVSVLTSSLTWPAHQSQSAFEQQLLSCICCARPTEVHLPLGSRSCPQVGQHRPLQAGRSQSEQSSSLTSPCCIGAGLQEAQPGGERTKGRPAPHGNTGCEKRS